MREERGHLTLATDRLPIKNTCSKSMINGSDSETIPKPSVKIPEEPYKKNSTGTSLESANDHAPAALAAPT
jgi:hypothetical protein